MRIIYGDLFDYTDGNIIGIPTNGFLTKKGLGVMGAGVALEVKKRWPDSPKGLGAHLQRMGNHVGWISTYPQLLLALPVKPAHRVYRDISDYIHILPSARHLYKMGDTIPGYHCFASPNLIERTLRELNDMLDSKIIVISVYMPLLGCGKGGLAYERVMPLIEKANLPDSVTLVLQPEGKVYV